MNRSAWLLLPVVLVALAYPSGDLGASVSRAICCLSGALQEAGGEGPSIWDNLAKFQSTLIALVVVPIVGFMTRWFGRTKARQEAVTAKRVEILDELGPHFVRFIIQLRFLALDGIEARLDSDLGRQHRAEYDEFVQGFHADTEILMLKTEQYFGRGLAYAERLERMARWCDRLDGIVTRLAEREGAGSVDGWREVRQLAIQLRPVYRELLEQMSHEVTEGKAVVAGTPASFDEAGLEALYERVTASA